MLRRGLTYSAVIHGLVIAAFVLVQTRINAAQVSTVDLTYLALAFGTGVSAPGGGSPPPTDQAEPPAPPATDGPRKIRKTVAPHPAPSPELNSNNNSAAMTPAPLPDNETDTAALIPAKADEAGPPEETAGADSGKAGAGRGDIRPEGQGGGSGGGGGDGADGVFTAGELDHPPVAISRKPPLYPPQARQAAIEGKVDIEILINDRGGVDDVRIIGAQPPGVFEESVKKTASGWRFKPGTVRGRPVKTLVATTVRFELKNLP